MKTNSCIPFVVVMLFSVAAIVGCTSTEAKKKEAYEEGKRAFGKGDYDLAIRCCSEAIRLDPEYTAAYYTRALAYVKNRSFDKAVSFSRPIAIVT
jgi:Flp pilus assembly protein TadD